MRKDSCLWMSEASGGTTVRLHALTLTLQECTAAYR